MRPCSSDITERSNEILYKYLAWPPSDYQKGPSSRGNRHFGNISIDLLRLTTLSRGALGNNGLVLQQFSRTRREHATVACGEPLSLRFILLWETFPRPWAVFRAVWSFGPWRSTESGLRGRVQPRPGNSLYDLKNIWSCHWWRGSIGYPWRV